jgi:hypothetical protein
MGVYVRVKNPIRKPKPIGDGICELELTQGYVGLIDESDAEMVGVCNWRTAIGKRDSYAYARGFPFRGTNKAVRLHRFLLGTDDMVDHINRNGIDNRRCNLRVITQPQNMANRAVNKNKVVPFKGVVQQGNRFSATCRGTRLGTFSNAIEAALAYDAAAIRIFGEYAATNASLGLLESGK